MHPGASRLSFVGLMEPEGFDKDKPVALDWEYDAMRHWDCNLGERHRCFCKDAYQVKSGRTETGSFWDCKLLPFFLVEMVYAWPLGVSGTWLVGKTFQFMDNLGIFDLGHQEASWNLKERWWLSRLKPRVFGFGFQHPFGMDRLTMEIDP